MARGEGSALEDGRHLQHEGEAKHSRERRLCARSEWPATPQPQMRRATRSCLGACNAKPSGRCYTAHSTLPLAAASAKRAQRSHRSSKAFAHDARRTARKAGGSVAARLDSL
eukprot:6209429-Pleurochrysis_carterae.AAC.1